MKSAVKLIEECMEFRGTKGLSHRTLVEFGYFVNLVMNSDNRKYTKYLKIHKSKNAVMNWIYRFRQYCEDEYSAYYSAYKSDWINNMRKRKSKKAIPVKDFAKRYGLPKKRD